LKTLKLMLVAGARPNFMKIASISDAVSTYNGSERKPRIDQVIVHTGQHYDEMMSRTFFQDLGIPKPDVDLEVGSGSHAQQTAEIMKRFESVLLAEFPDVVLVVGDVNSTIACSLVAAKLNYPAGASRRVRPLIAHVEAGLRSFDRSMPEEVNRVLTDAISDLHFVTEKEAIRNLTREGISKKQIYWVGNTMVDTLLKHRSRAEKSEILAKLDLLKPLSQLEGSKNQVADFKVKSKNQNCMDYALVTLHRPSNVDNRVTFQGIVQALSTISAKIPILFPVHPRTMNRIKEFELESHFQIELEGTSTVAGNSRLRCIAPLGYLDFLCLMSHARLILTDSGGIQEETTVLGVPCVTLRENTERPVTISEGTNLLAGTNKKDIVSSALSQIKKKSKNHQPRNWDGRAGKRIIKILVQELA
jgi:UDP-N-acetylglucosamine 2-epimerase (non-hydrolysing)